MYSIGDEVLIKTFNGRSKLKATLVYFREPWYYCHLEGDYPGESRGFMLNDLLPLHGLTCANCNKLIHGPIDYLCGECR